MRPVLILAITIVTAEVPCGLHLYSGVAYIWWVIASITGTMLVMMK